MSKVLLFTFVFFATTSGWSASLKSMPEGKNHKMATCNLSDVSRNTNPATSKEGDSRKGKSIQESTR